MGPIRCTETSAKDYLSTLHYSQEERNSHQHRGGSLKSRERLLVSSENLLKHINTRFIYSVGGGRGCLRVSNVKHTVLNELIMPLSTLAVVLVMWSDAFSFA
jgi:hypothetical protein